MQNRCQDVEVNQHHNAAMDVPRGAKLFLTFRRGQRTPNLGVPRRLKANEADEYFASTLSFDVCVRLCDEPSDFWCHTVGRRCGGDWCRYGGTAPLRKDYGWVDCAWPFWKRAPELVVVRLPNIKASASLSITAAPGLMQMLPISLSRSRIVPVFRRIWTPISPCLFNKCGQMPETANLRLDAAYGRLQAMIEEVGHANRDTSLSEAYSHSGAIERWARETVAHFQFGVEPGRCINKGRLQPYPGR